MARRAEQTTRLVVVLVLALATLTACSAAQQDGPPPRPPVAGTGAPPSDSRTPVAPPVAPPVATEAVHVPAPTAPATPPAAPEARYARPAWLGTRPLPLRDDGYGQVLPTPRRLRDRRLATPQLLPPPATTDFDARIAPVPAAVLRRSTWSAGCPVTRDDLRYVTVTFQGFDQLAHTGELLVHRTAARDMVSVFRSLYRARFPIEEMRVVAPAELDLAPTGDGNNTSAFVCRASRSSTSWSEHAYGRAVDVNPFHNPYVRDDLVLPELASAYVDRDRVRPGMVRPGDVVTQAFSDIGWGWGGNWDSLTDFMHFSANGR
jgi:hypothetical protein